MVLFLQHTNGQGCVGLREEIARLRATCRNDLSYSTQSNLQTIEVGSEVIADDRGYRGKGKAISLGSAGYWLPMLLLVPNYRRF